MTPVGIFRFARWLRNSSDRISGQDGEMFALKTRSRPLYRQPLQGDSEWLGQSDDSKWRSLRSVSVLAAEYRLESKKVHRSVGTGLQSGRLVAFLAKGRAHRSRLQIGGCWRRRGATQLFEVELIDATSVGLRNSYEIIIDLNLFAGLR